MKQLPLLLAGSALAVLFTGCVAEEPTYHRHHAYYEGGPRYREGADVVVYDNGGYDHHRDYYDREVNRTNVHERNVYRTNIYDQNTRRVSNANRARVTNQVQVQGKVVEKEKRKHHDHDQDQAQDHQ